MNRPCERALRSLPPPNAYPSLYALSQRAATISPVQSRVKAPPRTPLVSRRNPADDRAPRVRSRARENRCSRLGDEKLPRWLLRLPQDLRGIFAQMHLVGARMASTPWISGRKPARNPGSTGGGTPQRQGLRAVARDGAPNKEARSYSTLLAWRRSGCGSLGTTPIASSRFRMLLRPPQACICSRTRVDWGLGPKYYAALSPYVVHKAMAGWPGMEE